MLCYHFESESSVLSSVVSQPTCTHGEETKSLSWQLISHTVVPLGRLLLVHLAVYTLATVHVHPQLLGYCNRHLAITSISFESMLST